jgi:NAD(P)H-hydrate repair Nnr-like enzyme with NAD(P)H-hydrate dehydratase domain
MDRTYWHKQTAAEPLFPDLEWSRPQTAATAGKLLIVGGNAHGFVAAANAFGEAEKAGAGSVQMLLPDSLRPLLGKTFIAGELAASTPSGSFSQKALVEFLTLSQWADGVLLAGDLGRNSETAILIEKFLSKHEGQVTITQDAVDYIVQAPQLVLNRPDTTLVLSFAQLQKFVTNAHFTTAFTFDMDLLRLVDALHEFTEKYQVNIVTKNLQNIFVAVDGHVSSTKLGTELKVWRVKTASKAAVWWMQNPSKPFEALTTAELTS